MRLRMGPLRNGALLPEIRHVFTVGALNRTHYVPEVDLPLLLAPMQFHLTLLSKLSLWYRLLTAIFVPHNWEATCWPRWLVSTSEGFRCLLHLSILSAFSVFCSSSCRQNFAYLRWPCHKRAQKRAHFLFARL